MDIILSTTSSHPIYEQIIMQIKDLIAQNKLKADTMLPSMRKLAKDLQVSVITTKRAYEELEREGFIYTIPGKGSYVSKRDREMIREYYLTKIEANMMSAIEHAKTASLSKETLITLINEYWDKEDLT